MVLQSLLPDRPGMYGPREPLPNLGIRLLGNILRISVLLGLVSLSVISEERVDHSDVDRSSDFDTHKYGLSDPIYARRLRKCVCRTKLKQASL